MTKYEQAIQELNSCLTYSLSSECRTLAKDALEKVQQYESLGTIEKFQELIDKKNAE